MRRPAHGIFFFCFIGIFSGSCGFLATRVPADSTRCSRHCTSPFMSLMQYSWPGGCTVIYLFRHPAKAMLTNSFPFLLVSQHIYTFFLSHTFYCVLFHWSSMNSCFLTQILQENKLDMNFYSIRITNAPGFECDCNTS